jgi:hypothetical protein
MPQPLVIRLNRLESAISRKPKWIKGILCIALVILAIQVTLKEQGDYDVTYKAGLRIWTGEPIYRLDEPHPYMYSPLFAFAISPISYAGLPFGKSAYTVSKFLYFLLNLAGLGVSILLLHTILRRAAGGEIPAWVLVIPVVLSFRLILNSFQHGQSNLVVSALLLGALAGAQAGKEIRAGLLLAAAVAIKFLLPVPFLAYFAWRRRWKLVLTTMVLAASFFLFPASIRGWNANLELHRGWLHVLSVKAHDRGDQVSVLNQSLLGLLIRAGYTKDHWDMEEEGPPPGLLREDFPPYARYEKAYAVGTALLFGIVGLLLLRCRRRGGAPDEVVELTEYTTILLLMAIASPISWKHYFSIWFVPLSLLCFLVWRGHANSRLFLTAMTIVFFFTSIVARGLVGKTVAIGLQSWGSIFFCNLLLLACLLLALSFCRDPRVS